MKKLKIMALCILTATCSSCLDMLDKTPISQLSVGKLFETADGAEAAVSGCYSFLNGTGYYSQDIVWQAVHIQLHGIPGPTLRKQNDNR